MLLWYLISKYYLEISEVVLNNKIQKERHKVFGTRGRQARDEWEVFKGAIKASNAGIDTIERIKRFVKREAMGRSPATAKINALLIMEGKFHEITTIPYKLSKCVHALSKITAFGRPSDLLNNFKLLIRKRMIYIEKKNVFVMPA